MGKKRKVLDACDAGSVNKTVKYDDMPVLQKRKWVLCSDFSVLEEYLKLLSWICEFGTRDGVEFEGIRYLWCNKGYPLIEVEIVYLKESRNLLISRATLYILAFYSAINGWRKFKDKEFDIEFNGTVTQLSRRANYEGQPWSVLGLKALIKAFDDLGSEDETVAAAACEVFAVHLSEACRIRLIQSKIARSMMPCVSTIVRSDTDDLLLGSKGSLDIFEDIGPLVVDLNSSVEGGIQVRFLIKYYRQLCQAWIVYALSNGKFCPLHKEIADNCGVIYLSTLRQSLLVLCNTNLDKIVQEWVGKFKKGKCPSNLNKFDIKLMQSRAKEILLLLNS